MAFLTITRLCEAHEEIEQECDWPGFYPWSHATIGIADVLNNRIAQKSIKTEPFSTPISLIPPPGLISIGCLDDYAISPVQDLLCFHCSYCDISESTVVSGFYCLSFWVSMWRLLVDVLFTVSTKDCDTSIVSCGTLFILLYRAHCRVFNHFYVHLSDAMLCALLDDKAGIR